MWSSRVGAHDRRRRFMSMRTAGWWPGVRCRRVMAATIRRKGGRRSPPPSAHWI